MGLRKEVLFVRRLGQKCRIGPVRTMRYAITSGEAACDGGVLRNQDVMQTEPGARLRRESTASLRNSAIRRVAAAGCGESCRKRVG